MDVGVQPLGPPPSAAARPPFTLGRESPASIGLLGFCFASSPSEQQLCLLGQHQHPVSPLVLLQRVWKTPVFLGRE